jgi:hypothetical protein
MDRNIKANIAIAALLLGSTLMLVSKAPAASSPANADQLVAQHLDSIADAKVRASIKTRVVQGPVEFKILVGGAGTLDGSAAVVSDGEKLIFQLKLQNNLYHGEQFVFDGRKDSVAFSGAQQTRSPVGNFVLVQDTVIREGLLGGALSTAWPLLDLNDRKAKLSFEGTKKIDGKDLYDLRYRPHKNTDLEIHLYFDPETYHHVETTYSYITTASLVGESSAAAAGEVPVTAGSPGKSGNGVGASGSPETAQARLTPNRYKLTEKFSDFKTTDGVTLPTHEDIQFSQELQNGKTTLWDWDLKGLTVANNMGVDAKNFEVK